MIRPLISVIITTRNSEKTLERCLNSIKNQTYENIELIVVDNDSTDKTKEIASRYTKKSYNKGPERSIQRNFGAKNAEGEYLFFVDSDMELTQKVVEECVKKILKTNSKAIIIPEISVGEGFWAKCKALEKECYIGDETIEAARFFEKEIFFKFNGYDEKIAGGGEDWDLPFRIRKAGYKITRINALIKHHEGNLSLWTSMKKKYYYAHTVDKYIKKHPDMAIKQFTLLRPAFIRNWRRLARDPIHAIGMLFMKVCEFGAGGVGYLKCKFERCLKNE
jgi:glycosyltransferase involved in cell wall biosynthesis